MLKRPHAFCAAIAVLLLTACVDLEASAPADDGIAQPEPGSAEESYRLGLRYLDGDGIPRDVGQGLQLLQDAAEAGLPDAQFALGDIYANGRGVAREPAWATMWYGRAAAQGHADAQYRLGMAYVSGTGTQQDVVEAYKWFSIAAASGHVEAARARAALSNRMIKQEIEPAERAAAGWEAAPPDEDAPDEPLVRFVQFALSEIGYDSGRPDGIPGPRTRRAIRGFAKEERMRVDDITGDLVERLRARLRHTEQTSGQR